MRELPCPFCEESFISFATLQDHLFGFDCPETEEYEGMKFPPGGTMTVAGCPECGNLIMTSLTRIIVEEYRDEDGFARLSTDCFNCGNERWHLRQIYAPVIQPPEPDPRLVELVEDHHEQMEELDQ